LDGYAFVSYEVTVKIQPPQLYIANSEHNINK
jgi:hypothetical protein